MRNSIKLLLCAFCVFILYSFAIVKNNGPIEILLANLDSYATNYSPNKIYLQTDRSIYALEDTVWFKAYTLDATKHIPTTKSKVIYIDILDSNGNKVEGKKLFAENLGAASDFFIGREWLPGRYKLRAYTKFMLNQDQEFIYNKEIQIVDINKAYDEIFVSPDTANLEEVISPSPLLEIKFFPESGDLVAGIDSRVAIKIENYSSDLGNLTGTIEDVSGQQVIPFRVYERGYGLASFTPEAGKKYIAKLDNDPKLYQLPEVKATGYNITVFNKSDKVSFIISSNMKSGLTGGDVLIHSRGKLVYHETLDDIVNDSYALGFDTKEMPTGVMQITFFDKDGIPRSERLFFVDNDLSESVIKTDKAIYNKREKVDLSLSVINGDLKSYDCSVSVFDKSNLKGAFSSDNIKSWMLLNSDLRGEIKDPAFYFEKAGDSRRTYLLDLVMMTHGWRRFTWEDMRQKEVWEDLKYKKELGFYVKGYTSRLIRKKKPIKSTVMLNFLNNDLIQEEVVTGDDGRFEFGPYIIEDSLAVIVQARKYKEENEKDFIDQNRRININIDPTQYLNLKKPIFKENADFDQEAYKRFIKTNKYYQALKDQYHDMEVLLSEVVLTAKRKTKKEDMDQMVSERSIYSNPSNRIILNDRLRTTNRSVFDLLRNVPGLKVRGSLTNQEVTIRNRNRILFLINGFPIDQQSVNSINVNDVLFIDVLKGASAAVYGSRGGDGVIVIYTGTDPDSKITRRASGIVDIVINGFDKNRQFYAIDYSKNVSSVYEPDVRTTLYWNPYVLLSKGEENSFSFFTGDNAGNYIVTTEGLSEDGEPIFGTYEFSVKENE